MTKGVLFQNANKIIQSTNCRSNVTLKYEQRLKSKLFFSFAVFNTFENASNILHIQLKFMLEIIRTEVI